MKVIDKGAQLLGVERDKLIVDVIQGMRPVAANIGLGITGTQSETST